jgi:uncharacterized membrane protein
MPIPHAAAVSLHVLAAVTWIGGMVFLSLVLAPLIRNGAFPGSSTLFRAAAMRFRSVVWSAIAALLLTGPALATHRGIPLLSPMEWPPVFRVKLSLVTLLLVLTLAHDLLLGPLVSRINALPPSDRTPGETTLLRASPWLPRFALLTAIAVLVAAVVLVRS